MSASDPPEDPSRSVPAAPPRGRKRDANTAVIATASTNSTGAPESPRQARGPHTRPATRPGTDWTESVSVSGGHTKATPSVFASGRDSETVAERIGLPEQRNPVSLVSLPGERRFDGEGAKRDGKYLIGAELGRGGMGRVNAARDRDLGRIVALKTLLPKHRDDPAMKNALLFEARICGQLEHPGIVPIHDMGTLFDGSAYYAMKLVGTSNLRDVLNRRRNKGPDAFSLTRVLQLFQGVCMALDYAHARGVVHRDVKPANIVIGDYGEVQILDWGIAKIMPKLPDGDSLFGGVPEPETLVVGTPHYMSPEQARGATAEIGPQADVWSLGVILFELLTGALPFNDPDEDALVARIAALEAPAEVPGAGQNVPMELAEICRKALTPDPRSRFARARDLSRSIDDYLAGTRERERLAALAQAQTLVADGATDRYRRLRARLQEAEEDVRRDDRQRGHFDPLPERRRQWDQHLSTEHLRLVEARAFAESVAGYNQALAHQPDHGEARKKLQALYYERASDASERGDAASMVLYADLAQTTLVAGHDAEQARLHVRSYPTGATLRLFELGGKEELRQEDGSTLGTAPCAGLGLKPGSYLLSAVLPGCRESREPIVVRPGENKHVLVTLEPWSAGEPLIGRSDELAIIVDAFENFLAERRLQTLMITGEAGLGKGRLLIEFDRYLDSVPELVAFVFARCNRLHSRVPFRAITDIIRHRAGLRPGDDLEAIRTKVEDMVLRACTHNGALKADAAMTARAASIAHRLNCMPGLCGAAIRRPQDRGADFTFEVFEAVAEYIDAVVEMTPLVLSIRGADNLDRLTRDLLAYLGMRLADKPVFVMASAREDRMQLGLNRQVALRRMEPASVQHRLSVLFKGPVANSLSEFIAEKTDGNPLHVVELTRVLLRQGVVRWASGAWQLSEDIHERLQTLDLPQLMMLGLDHQPAETRETLEAAAICGPVFWRGEIEARLGRDISADLAVLIDAEMVAELPGTRIAGQQEYAFRYDSVQEALYERIAPPHRRTQHARVGQWLRQRHAEHAHSDRAIADIARAAEHARLGGDETQTGPLLAAIREEAATWELAAAPDWFEWPDNLASGVFTPERLIKFVQQ